MARIESRITVSRSVEETFAFLDEAENHARFIPNMLKFEKTSPGTFGRVGATARGMLRYLGIANIEVSYEIIEREPKHSLTMQGKMGSVLFKDGYILDTAENGAQIKFWVELNPTGWTTILRPFARLIGRVHAMETLNNLKRAIEKADYQTSEVK